ncbi:MAG: MATE family efflux transporter [Lachnospiraceae bacterium]|nr:MATE family efflux transporter [Lachnospiraceae bacterium]
MRRFIGDKKFYKELFAIALPIMAQNGISNIVNMLDNLMVGRIGTEQLSGVSIVNDLMFVYMLCLFGAISGAGIFTAQYHGQRNNDGVRDTFRIKVIICALIMVCGIAVFGTMDRTLISYYLHEGSQSGNLSATLEYGHVYMMFMLFGLLPQAAESVYSSTLRETGETVIPMRASFAAVFINLVLNYVLIYGKFGFPVLGVVGAAIATSISRIVQALIVIIWTHRHSDVKPYIKGAYATFRVSGGLVRKICITGLPLVLNESLWSIGIVLQKQSYSTRGLAVVAGMNINSTFFNVFSICFIAFGDAVAIMVGQLLGAGKMKEAKDTGTKINVFVTFSCAVMGTVLFFVAHLLPELYNTTSEVKHLATDFLKVTGALMPLFGLCHSLYFTIRAGGRTFITFLFDSAFLMVIGVPMAFFLTRYTGLDIVTIYALCEGTALLKVGIGFAISASGIWMQNIVEDVSG